MDKKPVYQEKTPASELPYRNIDHPFRYSHVMPGAGVRMYVDNNGVLFIESEGGASVLDLVAGDNININRTEDGKYVISAVDTSVEIAAGDNILITIDEETGKAVISSITGGSVVDEHYKGVFDTALDLIAYDTDPAQGDYGMIKDVTYTSGGDLSWNGRYKYCFYVNEEWTVVDQMLTFTDNEELVKWFYSVGGSSPVIYLPKVAHSGDFWDLKNVPIVETPVVTIEGNTVTATCATEGAEIWYTYDGSMPHVNGNKYTGPITDSNARSYRFVGIKNGMINSKEATASSGYQLQAPVISLDYTTGTVSIENPNGPGTGSYTRSVRYTTDGSTPSVYNGTEYTTPFVITNRTNIKAVVVEAITNMKSPVADVTYEKAEKPSLYYALTWPDGNSIVQITGANDGEYRYTVDNSTPSYSSEAYSGAIYGRIYEPVSYKFVCFREGFIPSDVRSVSVGYAKPVSPDIFFDAETNEVSLSIPSNQQGNGLNRSDVSPEQKRIYYTLDGSTPSEQNGTLYTAPFAISGNVTVKAVLLAYGEYYSDIATDVINITNAPVITLDSETGYISITGPVGSDLYYTIDGSTPTPESTQYAQPFSVENMPSVTVKAVAVISGQESSISENSWTGLKWTGSSYSEDDLKIGVTMRGPRRAENGATIQYAIVSGNGRPSSWLSYDGNYVTFDYFNASNPKAVWFRQTKPGYIPSNYGGLPYGYTIPDAPTIVFDESKAVSTISLSGNTTYIPLQTNNNVPEIGARIYYTLDGSTPSAQNGTLYDGVSNIPTPEGANLKAVTVCYGQYSSAVSVLARYPKISVSKFGILTVENTYGLTTRYTTDGSTPDSSSPLYTSPVDITNTYEQSDTSLTVKVACFENGEVVSMTASTLPIVHEFLATIKGGDPDTDDRIIGVKVNSDTNMDCYWYKEEGGVRVTDLEKITDWYENPQGEKVCMFAQDTYFGHEIEAAYQVMGVMEGYLPEIGTPVVFDQNNPDSPEVHYNDTTMKATFSLSGNTSNITLKTSEAEPNKGARIYYTTDGSYPDPQTGTLYDGGEITLSSGDILKAITECYGTYESNSVTQNIYVPESSLNDDDVAIVVKNTASGNLRYVPYASCDANAINSEEYALKPYLRFNRGKNSKPVFMHKDQTSGIWAEFNRYRLACDTSAPGGFDWAVTINGAAKSGSVSWQAGDTLDSILAQLTPQGVSTYLVFVHVLGEEFIRITKGGYSNSTFTLSNNTGATLTDLSFYTKIGDVQQTETHRDWQAMNVDAMLPSLGFLAANTVQYAVNGYNLSYMCGGNETQYKAYYRTNGASSYLAENAVSNRMSEAAFNAMDGSGNADAQALYDKYDGSWDAYMEASMVAIDDANANGIEYQSYDNGDAQTLALASVTTMDFDGSYIPAFPCAARVQSITDIDVTNGKFNMNTEHELAVFMRDAKLDAINSAFDVLIAAGLTATKISRTAYYYWSVARYHSFNAWFCNHADGRLDRTYLYFGLSARAIAYPVAQP